MAAVGVRKRKGERWLSLEWRAKTED